MMNKAAVALLLDQLRDSLRKIGILSHYYRGFHLFHDLFTFTGEVDSDEMIRALYVDRNDNSDPVAGHF